MHPESYTPLSSIFNINCNRIQTHPTLYLFNYSTIPLENVKRIISWSVSYRGGPSCLFIGSLDGILNRGVCTFYVGYCSAFAEFAGAELVDVGWWLTVLLEPVSQHEFEVSIAVDLNQGTIVIDLIKEGCLILVLSSLCSRPFVSNLARLAARLRAHRPKHSLRPACSPRKVLRVRLLRG